MGMFRDGYEDKIHALEKENEQLKKSLRCKDAQIENLRKRIERLTGCPDFGMCDGMNGACLYCAEENKALFDKCWNF